MSPRRPRSGKPQMLSFSKQPSTELPQTRTGAYVFSHDQEVRRRRIVAFVVAVAILVAIALAVWLWVWPR